MQVDLKKIIGNELVDAMASSFGNYQDDNWGGFGYPKGDNSVEQTFWCVVSMMMLKRSDLFSIERLADFLISCQNPDGGFGDSPATTSTTLATHQSLSILKLFGAIDTIDKVKTIEWISSLQTKYNSNVSSFRRQGGFKVRADTYPNLKYRVTLEATYNSLASLALLDNEFTKFVNLMDVIHYIESCQSDVGYNDGTFKIVDESTDPYERAKSDTIYALSSLSILNIKIHETNKHDIFNSLNEELGHILSTLDDDVIDFSGPSNYDLFFCLETIDMLHRVYKLDNTIKDSIKKINLNLSSKGDDPFETVTGKAGFSAFPYSTQQEMGGEIYPRSTFIGLANLTLLMGGQYLPTLGFPSEEEHPRLNLIYLPHLEKYNSCFISYSSQDQEFAECLYADLTVKGVRCWYAPEELKIGDLILNTINKAIRTQDKVLIIISKNSIESGWVEHEVMRGLEEEKRRNVSVLFPVRIDNAIMKCPYKWAHQIRNQRYIGDFSNWKNHDHFHESISKLLRDLKKDDQR